MDYQKMIFAAQVNDLASGIRASKRRDAYLETEGMMAGEREDAMQAWDEQYPHEKFIEPAFDQLLRVSKVVESLQSKAASAERLRGEEAMVRAIHS